MDEYKVKNEVRTDVPIKYHVVVNTFVTAHGQQGTIVKMTTDKHQGTFIGASVKSITDADSKRDGLRKALKRAVSDFIIKLTETGHICYAEHTMVTEITNSIYSDIRKTWRDAKGEKAIEVEVKARPHA